MARHQDELTHFEDLPLLAQLNIQVDYMAKQALHILGAQLALPLFSPLPGLLWALSIKSILVASNPHLEILNHVSHQ